MLKYLSYFRQFDFERYSIKMMSKVKVFFEFNFFFSNVLIPMIGLAIYCGSFAYFSSHFLLKGVSFFFASNLGKYLLLIIAVAILTLLIILKAKKNNKLVLKYSKEKLYLSDFLILLLPLTPVVQYTLNNQEILSRIESLYVLMLFALFSIVYIFALPFLLSAFVSTRILMLVGLAFVFTIASMASMSNYFSWFEEGYLSIQLLFFSSVYLAVWFLYTINKRSILYFFIVVNFVANSSVQLISEGRQTDAQSPTIEENKLLLLVGDRAPVIMPNIYLLVYDAYVTNETMLAYGIDNKAQEDFLNEMNFKLYPHTYSIGAGSIGTMSTVLNASNEYYGSPRRGVSGDGVTHRILGNLGYETYGLFPYDFFFQGIDESYDYSIPEKSAMPYIQLLKAIFIGEFRFDIEGFGFSEQTRAQFVEGKHKIFEDVSGKQVFIYMHTNLPSHSQNSGACLPDETDLFEERLKQSNVEMRQDIQLIIENDPGAIVIVAGDHGPYLTKNCYITTDIYDKSEMSRLDIQDRYGTFLAIRWPTGDFIKYDNITVLQDLFPAIFAYLYKDTSVLEAKIEPVIPLFSSVVPNAISGSYVSNGIIYGGINDGESLFLSDE